jgi:hypothetical protein
MDRPYALHPPPLDPAFLEIDANLDERSALALPVGGPDGSMGPPSMWAFVEDYVPGIVFVLDVNLAYLRDIVVKLANRATKDNIKPLGGGGVLGQPSARVRFLKTGGSTYQVSNPDVSERLAAVLKPVLYGEASEVQTEEISKLAGGIYRDPDKHDYLKRVDGPILTLLAQEECGYCLRPAPERRNHAAITPAETRGRR